ncbi:MAG: NAD-dependent epimerase/dehydratase family protein [Sneathiellaceae bacterium]
MTRDRTALVLGATGGFGGAMARRLAAGGWTVRALHRDPERGRARLRKAGLDAGPAIDWRSGDAMRAADVAAAADGAGLIVHAVNPPGYRNWPALVLPMLANSIAAARAGGARLLLPGTVYNYGPDSLPEPDEDAPQHPVTRKGRIRAEMERRLQAASADGAMSSLILRSGDHFGPGAGGSWLSQAMVRPGRPLRSVAYPGRPGIGHQWAYLPDVAETAMRLLDLPQRLPAFARFHMHGHWDEDGTQMVTAIRRAAAVPALRIRGLPWGLVALARPVVPLARELHEIRYLWEQPVRLGNTRLLCTLGAEPRTALDTAVATTLRGLGCLPPRRIAEGRRAGPALTVPAG